MQFYRYNLTQYFLARKNIKSLFIDINPLTDAANLFHAILSLNTDSLSLYYFSNNNILN